METMKRNECLNEVDTYFLLKELEKRMQKVQDNWHKHSWEYVHHCRKLQEAIYITKNFH